MTSSKLNHLPKVLPPNTITFRGVKASTYEFGEDTNIQSITWGISLFCSDSSNGFEKNNILNTSHQALYLWSPWGGHCLTGSAQEICEGISWWSQRLGPPGGGPGMLGSPAELKTALYL